jgi:hypothetical protein
LLRRPTGSCGLGRSRFAPEARFGHDLPTVSASPSRKLRPRRYPFPRQEARLQDSEQCLGLTRAPRGHPQALGLFARWAQRRLKMSPSHPGQPLRHDSHGHHDFTGALGRSRGRRGGRCRAPNRRCREASRIYSSASKSTGLSRHGRPHRPGYSFTLGRLKTRQQFGDDLCRHCEVSI